MFTDNEYGNSLRRARVAMDTASPSNRPHRPTVTSRGQEAETRALFAALDKDSNGFIDKNELRSTMSEVGLQLSDDDVDTMMKAAGVLIKDRIFYEGMPFRGDTLALKRGKSTPFGFLFPCPLILSPPFFSFLYFLMFGLSSLLLVFHFNRALLKINCFWFFFCLTFLAFFASWNYVVAFTRGVSEASKDTHFSVLLFS